MISGAPKIGTLRVGPSAQTILVAALEQLDGTLGRDYTTIGAPPDE